MQFVCYTSLDELPKSADVLFEAAERESVFFSKPWFENLLANAPPEGESVCLACVVEGECVKAILLLKDDNGYLAPLSHLYTSLVSMLLDKEGQREVLACLTEGLKKMPAVSLQVDPVAENDPNIDMLQQVAESSGFKCQRYFRFYNWIHRPQGESFADYLASRPPRVRNTITRKQRKLERELGYTIKLFTRADLQQGLADYRRVYSASWKADELFGGFIEGLAARFAERGWLRLAVLYVGDQPAAAQFWFVAHGKASIFKLAYDEAWKRYSPGSILTAYLMEHVIDVDRVDEIDFLTGNDAYKQEWMSERRERWRLNVMNSSGVRKRYTWPEKFVGVALKWLKQKVYN